MSDLSILNKFAPYGSLLETHIRNSISTKSEVLFSGWSKDELRNVIKKYTFKDGVLTFILQEGDNLNVDLNIYKIRHSSSIETEFYLSKGNDDYYVLIF